MMVSVTAVVLGLPQSVQPAGALGTGLAGPFTVRGNQILDNGTPTYLRGINLVGLEQNGSFGAWPDNKATAPYDIVDIEKIRSYNINVVRVPLGSQFWLPNQPPCMEHDAAYESAIDDVVNWITSQHMLALLDLHTEVPPGTVLCPGMGQQRPEPAPDVNAIAFWQQVASRYKGNPLVAFELFNEPHNISNSVWLNGGGLVASSGFPFVPGGLPYAATGMQQLYEAVRATGATNLVFIDGNNFAGDPSPIENSPVKGVNIVYAEHTYTCTSLPTTNCSVDPAPGINRWASVRERYPIVMTEFGWPDPTSATFNQNVVADVEALQPADAYAGWVAFAWGGRRPNEGFTPFGIFTSWSYSGCPATCQENDAYPTNPPGAAVPLVSNWARNR
jgi:hypothetical protein